MKFLFLVVMVSLNFCYASQEDLLIEKEIDSLMEALVNKTIQEKQEEQEENSDLKSISGNNEERCSESASVVENNEDRRESATSTGTTVVNKENDYENDRNTRFIKRVFSFMTTKNILIIGGVVSAYWLNLIFYCASDGMEQKPVK